MVSLELLSFARSHTDMQPISSNTHLTSLLLSGPPLTRESLSERIDEADAGEESHLDLSLLPPCLRSLAVDKVYVLPSSFAHINSPGLEALDFCWAQNSEEEVAALLQCLPQLKVINCCKHGNALFELGFAPFNHSSVDNRKTDQLLKMVHMAVGLVFGDSEGCS